MKKYLLIGGGIVLVSAAVFLAGGDMMSAMLNSGGTSASCQGEYTKILDHNKKDFSDCAPSLRNMTDAGVVPETVEHMMIAFDSSGSMESKIDGRTKMAIAKEATKKFFESIASSPTQIGVVVYGHKGSNSDKDKAASCAGVDIALPFAAVDAAGAKQAIDGFKSTGWTPIASAMKKGGETLTAKATANSKNSMLLVSDGEESCGGDPVREARTLLASPAKITTSIIGFEVTADDEAKLRAIASAGGGTYYSANNSIELNAAFQKYQQAMAKHEASIANVQRDLRDVTETGDRYFHCLLTLKEEAAGMTLDVHASKLASPSCADAVDAEYQKRYDSVYTAIKAPFDEAMASIKNRSVIK